MPNYQYECKNCNYSFEELQLMTAKKLKICPKCKKPDLMRLIGKGYGIIFKGQGFWATDYRKETR